VAGRRYFGTDGVRGVYGGDLTEELVRRLGLAFARWAGGAPVLVGRDTRASGPALEEALAAGLAAGGSAVTVGGVLPTPAVALLAEGCGAVVSASHNPPEYNGVKFFGPDGFKLSDADEAAVEALLDGSPAGAGPAPVADETARDRYADAVVERFGVALDGLRIACDCANGAMAGLAPAVLERLGATVTAVGDAPDGTNINAGCGATSLGFLQGVVREDGHDLGVAFDGDADRMLAVDASGDEVDGDAILAVLALHLGVDLVAVTEMTNLGFHRLMAERGVRVVTTPVGDRYVLEALRREGGRLGGEQSGHILWLDGLTSGDGLVAALLLLRAVVESGRPLAELASMLERYPQASANVPVRSKELTAAILAEVAAANETLGSAGRVVVRPSGTEPVVRVLAEAEAPKTARDLCARIADLVAHDLS
jgi:phosphoglucosamine mutase